MPAKILVYGTPVVGAERAGGRGDKRELVGRVIQRGIEFEEGDFEGIGELHDFIRSKSGTLHIA